VLKTNEYLDITTSFKTLDKCATFVYKSSFIYNNIKSILATEQKTWKFGLQLSKNHIEVENCPTRICGRMIIVCAYLHMLFSHSHLLFNISIA
jgi:hypothetical protein